MNSKRGISILVCILCNCSIILAGVFNHSHFTGALQDHVVAGAVDYEAIKSDKQFIVYINVLTSTDPSEIVDEKDRLAFWINAYNAFAIKLVCDNLPLKSINELGQGNVGARDIVWIDIGGEQYSLNQIEHEIIRKEFDEPRIHFALVCAAKGYPPLRSEAYVASRLDEQLDDNARAFLLDTTKNRYDRETKTLFLSELLNLKGHNPTSAFVMEMFGMKGIKPATVKFIPFDWSLNAR